MPKHAKTLPPYRVICPLGKENFTLNILKQTQGPENNTNNELYMVAVFAHSDIINFASQTTTYTYLHSHVTPKSFWVLIPNPRERRSIGVIIPKKDKGTNAIG